LVVAILGILALGVGLVLIGYQNAIYPLDKAMGYLSRAESSQTPAMMAGYLAPAKLLLPSQGNPVWSFPNPTTDFRLIQNDLEAMIQRTDALSSVQPNSAAYNTGLEDLHDSIKVIELNLEEATPYVYVSYTNVLLSILWVGVIISLFAALRRGKDRRRLEYEDT
jgi:type II secretory pathway pseudopilin PulG